jgi:hypothetical protein
MRLLATEMFVQGYQNYKVSTVFTYLNHKERFVLARSQSKFPTRPTASKPYIERSDCAYVIEQ